MGKYAAIGPVLREVATLIRPPQRVTVPEASVRHVRLSTPGGYSGPWSNDLVPYLVRPAECLNSRYYRAVIFVGPAQSAKTQMLVDNWTAHTIKCDPTDMMIVQTAQDTARDYSRRRIDRMLSNSPDLGVELAPGGQSDNVFDKYFRSGAILSLGWPSKNQLAGKAIPKMALTDYDRMSQDVGGEGAPFYLALKRTTTFLSRGMTMAESSPSQAVLNPKWKPSRGSHEGPPTKGILGLFNQGTRERLFWQCQQCGEFYMPPPGPEGFWWPDQETDLVAAAEQAGAVCTVCAQINQPRHEKTMIATSIWVAEGQTIDRNGQVQGEGRRSDIASFWLPGAAAAFQPWKSLILGYLLALESFDRTGDEEALKNSFNLDFGTAYIPQALLEEQSSTALADRAEGLPKRLVPEGVRFLVATVDVQLGRFVVQVLGVGVEYEAWIIDRFNIRKADRLDEDGERDQIDPAGHAEDWDVLIDQVILRRYPLADGSGRLMPVWITGCDSGGEAGVTDNAYDFWRRLKTRKLVHKFALVKGASSHAAPRVKLTHPDSSGRADRKSNARGDVPVYQLNPDLWKDAVDSDLKRKQPGKRYIHFPKWLGGWFYDELNAESRGVDGKWTKPPRVRNEALDLLYYARALIHVLAPKRINWGDPPPWARPWDENPEILGGDDDPPPAATNKRSRADLARLLNR